MSIQDIIEGKRQLRAHMARVKALPPDYRIAYKEIQRYLFKVGPADVFDGRLLSGIVDFFEEGAAAGKGVLELIGNDVAAFCDDLVNGSHTCAGTRQEPVSGEPRTTEKSYRRPRALAGASGRQGVAAEPVRVSPDTPGELSSFSARRQIRAKPSRATNELVAP